jgi:hypothetical protein
MKALEQFQKALLDNIHNDEYLSGEIKHLSFSPQQNPELPYVTISDIDATLSYLHEKIMCEINFSICLYSRGEHNGKLQQIHQKLNEVIAKKKLDLVDYKIVIIKELGSSIEYGKDLATTKLTMRYNAMMR